MRKVKVSAAVDVQANIDMMNVELAKARMSAPANFREVLSSIL